MGFPDVEDFDIEFIEKTQSLINSYKGPLSFTLLTNCMLGLVILIYDRIESKNIAYYRQTITNIPQLKSVREKADFVFKPVTNKGEAAFPDLKKFIELMRHGLAHPKITPQNGRNKEGKLVWKSVEFQYYSRHGKNAPVQELRAQFTLTELKKFTLAISTAYQKNVLGIL